MIRISRMSKDQLDAVRSELFDAAMTTALASTTFQVLHNNPDMAKHLDQVTETINKLMGSLTLEIVEKGVFHACVENRN